MEEDKTEKYNIGPKGAAELRKLLASKFAPQISIPKWQKENGLTCLELPQDNTDRNGTEQPADSSRSPAASVDSILQMVDCMQVPRHHVYSSIHELLSRRLIDKIQTCDNQQKLHELLQQAFKFLNVEKLRPIIVELLQRLRPIPEAYLQRLAEAPDALPKFPLDIRRQVWESNAVAFHHSIRPLVVQYTQSIKQHPSSLIAIQSTRKRRDELVPVQGMLEIIGEHVGLYQQLVMMILRSYLDTEDPVYSMLRFDLLMAFHDKNIPAILQRDGSHNFAWLLDACVREQHFQPRYIQKLRECVREVGEGQPLIGELALMTSNPAVQYVILQSISLATQEIVEKQIDPSDHEHIHFYCDLLCLSLSAQKILAESLFRFPKASRELFGVFFPRLIELITAPTSQPIHPELSQSFLTELFSREVILHYWVWRLNQADSDRVLQLIALVLQLPLEILIQPSVHFYIQIFYSTLIHNKEKLNEEQRSLIFEQFFVQLAKLTTPQTPLRHEICTMITALKSIISKPAWRHALNLLHEAGISIESAHQ
eukprot:TRINITY_DN4660_c0_g1_i14.p1 TRINITY_DN4660_c0_g1~~TRINITY_DN4660_c0_g1_i14.p1  ORF type:complete len:540 (+),score=88.03 TRINITY_DN4660_c0_g1_i14:67-1686(+)